MASTSLPSCLLLALSFLVSGVPARYSPGDYKPDIGDGPPTDYGRPVRPNCHLEQKTTFQDRCEDYDEKTCWTQNEEHCSSYLVNTCTPVVNTGVDRRCFNVTELICELVESVHYRQVEENFHVHGVADAVLSGVAALHVEVLLHLAVVDGLDELADQLGDVETAPVHPGVDHGRAGVD